MTPRDRGRLRLSLARYQGVLFLALVAAPLALAALVLGRSSDTDMTTGIGLPLYGNGRVPIWVLLCMYVATITGPLLSWSHADIEVSSSRFAGVSLHVPHVLALSLALITLLAVSSGPSSADALFWVASSMAAANLWALLARQLAWAGVLLSEVVVLSMLLQDRLTVWRGPVEAGSATLVWICLALANIHRQARLSRR
jgi:hypothetical protein